MRPLEELLDRIRWDAEFGKGTFALGYYDRLTREERIIPFESVTMDPQRPGTFALQDANGLVAHVPFHRVRKVYKDGAVIWQRPRRPQ
jgi:uncharacterized protein (UPF0248 family)